MNRKLNKLLPGHQLPGDIEVNGITRDSRKVEPGNLFVAVPGIDSDGRQFIEDAISRNAGAVLYEEGWESVPRSDKVPVIGISDLGKKVGDMASRFFEHPSMDLRIVAVTGTNGKTSCSHFIASALEMMGVKCGVVGTLGSGFPEALKNPGLTTPESIELQKILATMKADGADAVAMEASSHGLDQGRLDGTNIDIAVLTNISRDHLDYHDHYEQYKKTKSRLFLRTGLSGMVLNIDDDLGRELNDKLLGTSGLLTYSRTDMSADIVAEECEFNRKGSRFRLKIPGGHTVIESPLIGDFNISNLLALAGVMYLLQFPVEKIRAGLSSVKGVKGRMDVLHNENCPTIVIDYAHTPDALEKALKAIRVHCEGNLWCVFGCGGDRDKGKRPQMGKIAFSLADRLVVTDDNPRNESSENIIENILAGIDADNLPGNDKNLVEKVTKLANREEAIKFAFSNAEKPDWVLVAGKGHESYQEVQGEKIPFSDYEVVRNLLMDRSGKFGAGEN